VIGFDAAASSIIVGVLVGGIFALTALGLSLVLGVLRLVNLAHGEFLVIGAYAGYYLLAITGIDPLLGLPLIAIGMAAVAAPLFRYLVQPVMGRGVEAPMMTMFGLSIVLQNLYFAAFSADTRSIETWYSARALTLGSVTVGLVYVIGFVIAIVIVALVHVIVARSAFGRDLRASAQDPIAAAVVGVNVSRVRMLTFALGAACAGAGGTLSGLAFSFTPSSGAAFLLNSFAVVVLGGLGNVLGTLIAGIAMGVLQSLGGVLLGDGYRDLVALLLFLAVLVVRPQGLLAGRS
jgi:branched-chain amino acid transport system permease protein